jgi:hypothetical protein
MPRGDARFKHRAARADEATVQQKFRQSVKKFGTKPMLGDDGDSPDAHPRSLRWRFTAGARVYQGDVLGGYKWQTYQQARAGRTG